MKAGTRATVETVQRALNQHQACGLIRGWNQEGNLWHVTTSDYQEYTLTGLAQAHALAIGLASAEQATRKAREAAS